jgi:hypothetical protein
MKEAYEKDASTPHKFQEGNKVMISAKDIAIYQASKKLGPKQLGPYTVKKKVGELSYKLDLPAGLHRLHPVFHVDCLSPWKGNKVNGELPPPLAPVEVEGKPKYEVEKVLDSRFYWRQLQYLVKWKGYDSGHNLWEPAGNLDNAKDLVQEFHQRNPAAPRKISAALFAAMPWSTVKRFTEDRTPEFSWTEGKYTGK